MQIDKMSTKGILHLHEAIRKALEADDSRTDGKKDYLVRELPDWKEFADSFENELRNRSEPFNPIVW